MLLVIVLQSFNITMKKTYSICNNTCKGALKSTQSLPLCPYLPLVLLFPLLNVNLFFNPTLHTKGFVVSQFLPDFFLSFDSFEFNPLKSRNFTSSTDEKHLTSDFLA